MNSQIVQGKGNLLDIVREYDLSLTGNYIRINGNDPERIEKGQGFMQKNGKRYLLRSDATCEDKSDATFAGLFNSLEVTSNNFEEVANRIEVPHNLATLNPLKLQEYFTLLQKEKIERVNEYFDFISTEKGQRDYYIHVDEINRLKKEINSLESILTQLNFAPGVISFDYFQKRLKNNFLSKDAKKIDRYSKFREVSMFDSRMDFILHEFYDFNQVLMMQHPNYEDLIHVEFFFEDKMGYPCSKSFDFFIEDKDRFKDIYSIPGLTDLVTHYQNLMKDSRLDKNYSYLMEAGVEPTKIVQLRPFLKKELVEIDKDKYRNQNGPIISSILGNIPSEGIVFDFDKITNSYPGLYLKKKKLKKDELPYDVSLNKEIKVMIEDRCSYTLYLEHSGVLNLEKVISYDNSLLSKAYLKEIWGAPKIRYFEIGPGIRRFEVVE